MSTVITPIIGQERQSSNFAVSSRKVVAEGKDVHVKEFLLQPGEEIPWHHHTAVFDVFYCLDGRLDIDCADVWSGKAQPTVHLKVGESLKLEPGTAHRPHNPLPSATCRFLLVQGVGEYDWLRYQPKTGGK